MREAVDNPKHETSTAQVGGSRRRLRRRSFGLSGKLLILTLGFVMLAEVLIYVPSVANYRKTWLEERLTAARTAVSVLDMLPVTTNNGTLSVQLLDQVGAMVVAVRDERGRRLIAADDTSIEIAQMVDLRRMAPHELITDAFKTLMFGGERYIRVVGVPPGQGDFIEIVIDDTELRDAMVSYSINILILSLIISVITAALVYVSLRALIVRPVQRLTETMSHFAENPEDRHRIIVPSGRADELGDAERRLADMQTDLASLIAQKNRLASLGLAVSKINHDLRNLLASAQLTVDRVGEIDDPTVRRFAPRLLATLDRAVAFCENTLKYGSAAEPPPDRAPFCLSELVSEIGMILHLDEASGIRFVNDVPADLALDADRDQFYRVILNLCRNAVQALDAQGEACSDTEAAITVSARETDGGIAIDVSDTGPGVPARARERLFEAFHGSTRPGGTGLGLAISAELVRAHGGKIALVEGVEGACFRIDLPHEAKVPGTVRQSRSANQG
ncbi:MAG: HAMP domain-containing sensor histidine kinase [Pseudomonadota bacterium]